MKHAAELKALDEAKAMREAKFEAARVLVRKLARDRELTLTEIAARARKSDSWVRDVIRREGLR